MSTKERIELKNKTLGEDGNLNVQERSQQAIGVINSSSAISQVGQQPLK